MVIFYEHRECKTPCFFEAQHATSLGTPSEAFLKFSNTKHKFIFLTKYFSCNCIRIEMVFLVSHPVTKPNCISLMSTCIFIALSTIFRIVCVRLIPYSFLFLKQLLSRIAVCNSAKFIFCWNNSSCNLIYYGSDHVDSHFSCCFYHF